MSTSGYCCHYCGQATEQTCPECNALCCLPCGANLCPLCVRIKLALTIRALSKRLVPWQHVEASMLPISHPPYLLMHDSDKPRFRAEASSAPT
jgi:hypothetical protein